MWWANRERTVCECVCGGGGRRNGKDSGWNKISLQEKKKNPQSKQKQNCADPEGNWAKQKVKAYLREWAGGGVTTRLSREWREKQSCREKHVPKHTLFPSLTQTHTTYFLPPSGSLSPAPLTQTQKMKKCGNLIESEADSSGGRIQTQTRPVWRKTTSVWWNNANMRWYNNTKLQRNVYSYNPSLRLLLLCSTTLLKYNCISILFLLHYISVGNPDICYFATRIRQLKSLVTFHIKVTFACDFL